MIPTPISAGSWSVLPTPTDMLQCRVVGFERMTLEVKNTDGSQTLSVYVWRRASDTGDFSLSPFDLLASIAPGESKCVDLDVLGTTDVLLRGTASGIGLTATTAGQLVRKTP